MRGKTTTARSQMPVLGDGFSLTGPALVLGLKRIEEMRSAKKSRTPKSRLHLVVEILLYVLLTALVLIGGVSR